MEKISIEYMLESLPKVSDIYLEEESRKIIKKMDGHCNCM